MDSLPAESQGKPQNTEVGTLIPSLVDLPDPGIRLGSPALQVDSLPAELPGKPVGWWRALANEYFVSASVLNKLAAFYIIHTDTLQKKTNMGN